MITAIKAISDFMGENSFFLIRGVCFTLGGLACFFYTEPTMALISIIGVLGYSRINILIQYSLGNII